MIAVGGSQIFVVEFSHGIPGGEKFAPFPGAKLWHILIFPGVVREGVLLWGQGAGAHHIALTGDIYINVHGLTSEQAAYNQYAPILMTSVDTSPKLCAEERTAIMQRLGVGQWQIFGAHGFKKDYSVNG